MQTNKSAVKTASYVLPAQWASYLINGDSSSFNLPDEGELFMIELIEDWVDQQGLDACLDVSNDSFFSWTNDGPMKFGFECATYTFSTIH
jgi:hypothetical protein